jgi:plasmid stabilization system protein ParE
MARLVVAPAAVEDLERLILTHSLPADTKARVSRSLRPLTEFPLLGAALLGRWEGFRFILGPWRWLVIVYAFESDTDQVLVVTIQDGRSSQAEPPKS